MISPHWQHFEHKADIGIRGFGNTPAEAFAQAALAMSAIITELSLVADKDKVAIVCEDEELDLLFVDWLNAVIYEISTRQMLFSRFQVVQ